MIEIAMVISKDGFPLATAFGSPGLVVFPQEYMWETHKRFPGLLQVMAHTHPFGLTELSEEDRTTLKAWTFAIYPYAIAMDVICKTLTGISHKRYWYDIESREDWIARGKQGERQMMLKQTDLSGISMTTWVHEILRLSENVELMQ